MFKHILIKLSAIKKRLPLFGIGLILTCLFVSQSAGWLPLPFIDRLDGIIYDLRLRLTAPGGIDSRVVIVDIDEKSLQEREAGGEGRWPWPRDRLALLTNRLFNDYKVDLVGFDVIFSERDESSGIRTFEKMAKQTLKNDGQFQAEYQRMKPLLDLDGQFAASFKDRSVVLSFSFLNPGDQQKKGLLPTADLSTKELPLGSVDALQRQGYTANLAILQKNAADGGHLNPIVDVDGILRRVPMLIEHDGNYYQSLSLASVKTLLGGVPIETVPPPPNLNDFGSLEALNIGGAFVPVDEELTAFIPYRGAYKSFDYVSASDILNETVPKDKLQGKIILVGTTAPGLLDLRATPVGKAYPGVEIHANMIAGILDGTIKHAPSWTRTANFTLVLILGSLLALVLPWMSPLWGSILSLLAIIGVVGLNFFSYEKGIVLPLASVLGAALSIYLFNIGYGYFIESRSKRLITGLFGQYIPPELVDEMAKNPDNFSMEGQNKELTVLFSDVRGFTTISESLDAKTLSEFINAFLTPFTKVIYNNRGTIDKYMGDCIMAFWGAPIDDADHARHGVMSAFQMLKAMEELNLEFAKRNWPAIKVGIGLNTGKMSVGNMGSEIRLAYTIMGDAVNLGSRLEGITKEYGVAIIIGPDTRTALPDLIARELDRVRVKGKDIPVTIYEPLGFGSEVSADKLLALGLFEKALANYRDQQWDIAQQQLEDLLNNHRATGEVLYELYLERIGLLRENPPGQNWDGSFTFTKK